MVNARKKTKKKTFTCTFEQTMKTFILGHRGILPKVGFKLMTLTMVMVFVLATSFAITPRRNKF